MDVVGEVSLKTFLEVPAQVEGGVEDANIPTPGTLGQVHEDVHDEVCGAGDKYTKDCATLEMPVLRVKAIYTHGNSQASYQKKKKNKISP